MVVKLTVEPAHVERLAVKSASAMMNVPAPSWIGDVTSDLLRAL